MWYSFPSLGKEKIQFPWRFSSMFMKICSMVLYTLSSKSLTWNINAWSSGCNALAFYVLYMYLHLYDLVMLLYSESWLFLVRVYTTKQNFHKNWWKPSMCSRKMYFLFPLTVKRIPCKFQNFGLIPHIQFSWERGRP